MNTNSFFDVKKKMYDELGDKYPMNKNELTIGFLLGFANYLDGPKEEDYGDDYRAYEDAKYSSEQWAFIWRMTQATALKLSDNNAFPKAWDEFLVWVTDNYFPEFTEER